jgi:hypothetical protein
LNYLKHSSSRQSGMPRVQYPAGSDREERRLAWRLIHAAPLGASILCHLELRACTRNFAQSRTGWCGLSPIRNSRHVEKKGRRPDVLGAAFDCLRVEIYLMVPLSPFGKNRPLAADISRTSTNLPNSLMKRRLQRLTRCFQSVAVIDSTTTWSIVRQSARL